MDAFTEKIIIVIIILASLFWFGTYIIGYADEKFDTLLHDNKKSLRRLKKLMILQYVNLTEQIKSLRDKSVTTQIDGTSPENILTNMPISLEEAKEEIQNQKKSPFDKAEESFDTVSGLNTGGGGGSDFATF